MRAAKARKHADRTADMPQRWSPPALRRIIVVIDLDSGRPLVRMMQLWRGDRIDRFRVRSPSGESSAAVGWSRILARVRKAYPRTLRLED